MTHEAGGHGTTALLPTPPGGPVHPEPAHDRFTSGEVGFELAAVLPGPDRPRPAIVRAGETWAPIDRRFERAEYLYDLIEHQLDRRRALHAHHADVFARRFGRLLGGWGQPEPLGCAALRCLA